MISHYFAGVSDFPSAMVFYSAVLPLVGWKPRFVDESRPWAGWQPLDVDRPLFLVGKPYDGQAHSTGNGQMIALLAPSRKAVDDFYRVALESGGRCDGPPGLRPEYHENYYGAYIRDPDGNKLCVCCHSLDS
jgi:catechol 2,3-dioxygenase-like lactoylglutathione lyase family enzyme